MNITRISKSIVSRALVGAVVAGLVAGSITAGATAANAVDNPSFIAAGEQLHSGEGIDSFTGQFHLGMQGDGNLVLTSSGNRAIWSTKTGGHPGAYLAFQKGDGNLVVYSADNKVLWSPLISSSSPGTLNLQADGNIVVKNASGGVVWSPGTNLSDLRPGDTLQEGYRLYAGNYNLIMQGDGNLVQLEGGKAIWSTQTGGNPGAFAAFQTDGNFVVKSASNQVLFAKVVSATGGRFGLDSTGNVFITKSDGTIAWQTKPAAETSVKAVAQRLVNFYNAGKLTFSNQAVYSKEIASVAANGAASAGCAVDPRILQVLAMTVANFGSAYVTDVQRTCVGSDLGCNYNSLHCAQPGQALDLAILGGTVLNGSNAKDVAYLRFLDTIVPSGSQVGQRNCRASNPISLTNIAQPFDDACNHDHFDLGRATGAVKYTP
jgi:hypothetical protein